MFLGATNEPWSLDPAVLRPGRFDAKVYVPLPDPPARLKLFEIYVGKRPMADDVNLPALVEKTNGYSGADIKAICARAASRPFLESVEGTERLTISMADLLVATETLVPSVSPKDCVKFEQWAQGQG